MSDFARFCRSPGGACDHAFSTTKTVPKFSTHFHFSTKYFCTNSEKFVENVFAILFSTPCNARFFELSTPCNASLRNVYTLQCTFANCHFLYDP